MNKAENLIKIIAKLMNERDENLSEAEKYYNKLTSCINSKLPKVLDQGDYTENALIIQELEKILKQYEIFSIVPELIEKTVAVVIGKSSTVEKKLMEQVGIYMDWISFNTNLPMIFVNGQRTGRKGIYALTYMNKLVSLTQKEYQVLTKELYKNKIEIRKLIKAFLVFENSSYSDLAFLLMPEYTDLDCEIIKVLKETIQVYYFAIDREECWKKMVKRLPQQIHELCIITENSLDEKNLLEIQSGYKGSIYIEKNSNFSNMCFVVNRPCINFTVQVDIQNILMDVDVYYVKKEKSLGRKIELLAKDSLNLTEGAVKEQVKTYRQDFLAQKSYLLKCQETFFNIKEEIQKAAFEYENSLSKTFVHHLSEHYFVSRYQSKLLTIYFKHIRAQYYEKAKEDILRLTRMGYPYSPALESLIKWMQGDKISKKELTQIKQYPYKDWGVAKIKIVMAKELGYQSEDLKKFAFSLPSSACVSGKEWYYLGKGQLDQKDFINASKNLRRSLNLDYSEAGDELIQLAQEHPECKINIEELAENLVPEANYYIGCKTIYTKKGIVNLKMAASRKYIDAIEKIAEIEFKRCQKISWQKVEEKENSHIIYNVIDFYLFLNQKRSKTEYLLRIGLMYCKLKDYIRAYSYLKNLEEPEALYECAKMFQYGNGVAKNLITAKKYYEKIEGNYRDSKKQYQKVCDQIEKEKVKKGYFYSEKRDYSEVSDSPTKGSSFCFITTAACLALHQTKDCEELNLLRYFRDTYILQDGKDGKELIEEYYRIAPILITYIDCEWNPFAVYMELWQDYILPSCLDIRLKNWETAKGYYIDMVRMLCEKYSVMVKKEIQEKYQILTDR